MSLKYGLLGLLNYGSMTGYELNKAFKDSLSFFWQAQTSQVYRELSAMERSGWLTSERVIQNEKPNKKIYTITAEGKAQLGSWLLSPEKDIEEAMNVRCAFLMRVFFAGETDNAQALVTLRAFRAKCAESISRLASVAGAITGYGALVDDDAARTKYWEIVAMFGEAHYRMEIEWADKVIAMLEAGE
jgi:DNA-binding PadR family transcriptional regulator